MRRRRNKAPHGSTPAHTAATICREDSFEGQTELMPAGASIHMTSDAALRAAFGPSPIFGVSPVTPAVMPSRVPMPSPRRQASEEIVDELEALKFKWQQTSSLNLNDLLEHVREDTPFPQTTPAPSPLPSPPFDDTPWSRPAPRPWNPTPSEAYSEA